jgi:hypothetical protein
LFADETTFWPVNRPTKNQALTGEIQTVEPPPKPPERRAKRKPAGGDGRLSETQNSKAGRPPVSHGSQAESRGRRLPRAEDFGGQLTDLARQVARLGPDRRNPEGFHEDKSEIADQLRRIARALGGAA